jgi:hypothetical protein
MARHLPAALAAVVLAAGVSAAAAVTAAGPAAQAGTVTPAVPGAVPTTSIELTGGFLVPQFKSVPEHGVSPYFYGHDQGAARPSQPAWITARWYNLPPISPDAPDGSPILSHLTMAAPQLSINQFEGLTIPGQYYLLSQNPLVLNPFAVKDPDLAYPLMWQFKGQGSLTACGTMAANVIRQALHDYSGASPWRLAAQDVPTLYYAGGGASADPRQTLTFTAQQAFTATQQVSATVKSPTSISGGGAGFTGGIGLPTLAGTGTLGASEEESTQTAYEYTNDTQNKEDYIWLSTEADYYTTVGVPYVFYKPAAGRTVMAEYPDGLGPFLHPGTLPAGWAGNLGSWQRAQTDPGIPSDTTLKFPWLAAGTCYVGESLTLARILHPNEAGLHLIAQAPFNTGA